MSGSYDGQEMIQFQKECCYQIAYLLFSELLPGIEEFLVKALAREKLALATEKKRLFFIERLEVIKMPPSLPPGRGPRPTGRLSTNNC